MPRVVEQTPGRRPDPRGPKPPSFGSTEREPVAATGIESEIDERPARDSDGGGRSRGRRGRGSSLERAAEVNAAGDEIASRWFGQSSFATHCVTAARNVVVVDPELPIELLGPLGCGILTGAGSVLVGLPVREGASFVVFGAGAVGRPKPYDDNELQRAAETLAIVAPDFEAAGVLAAIEPIRPAEAAA